MISILNLEKFWKFTELLREMLLDSQLNNIENGNGV